MGRDRAAAWRGGAWRKSCEGDCDALPALRSHRGFSEPSLYWECGKEEAIYLQADVDAAFSRGIHYPTSETRKAYKPRLPRVSGPPLNEENALKSRKVGEKPK